ncbi:MAG: putative ABC transporter permease, partial [Clostridia bacterium]
MDIFYTCLFLFMIGSFCGWCIELLFRRFFSTKRWVNPGFLNGPYLPLYGFGVVAMYGICSIPIDLLWKIVIIVVSMTLIEYITGLIFIKGLKIKLWDYSARWGNLQGIICPLFSAIWGICGVVFLFVIYPLLSTASVWLSVHKNFLFVIGLFYGVFAVDIAISFKLSSRIRKIAKEIKEVVEFESLKQQIESYAKTNKKSY